MDHKCFYLSIFILIIHRRFLKVNIKRSGFSTIYSPSFPWVMYAANYFFSTKGYVERWLLPDDTRMYDPAGLPDFGPVDVVFAHVWLSKACAASSTLPLLEEFCRFYTTYEAKRILLTHLNEQNTMKETCGTRGMSS